MTTIAVPQRLPHPSSNSLILNLNPNPNLSYRSTDAAATVGLRVAIADNHRHAKRFRERTSSISDLHLLLLRDHDTVEKRDESGYNPFRNDVEDDSGIGKSSSLFGLRSDEGSATQLSIEFLKLNVRDSDGPGSSGGAFTSSFEFRSVRSDDVQLPDQLRKLNLGKDKINSFGFGNVRSAFSGLNGSIEAKLFEKMEHVRIEDRVGVSTASGAGESLAHENLKNGINDEFQIGGRIVLH